MNRETALHASSSLLERAAEMYDFGAELRRPAPDAAASEAERVEEEKATFEAEPGSRQRALAPYVPHRQVVVDRERLRASGFIDPGKPAGTLAEEFRIIKRQLLIGVEGGAGIDEHKRQSILVCSAQPNEGKTFCAVNLALSLASEKDVEVLLVDADFAKPEILSLFGVEEAPGLIDLLDEPNGDPETYVIGTDIRGFSLLPSGRRGDDVPELVASDRMAAVLSDLTRGRSNCVLVMDSPPVLMASPASVLATLVGQVMMVVRADRTTEADLREAVSLLSGCDHVSLMLNSTAFAATSRRFGSYYGYGPHETA